MISLSEEFFIAMLRYSHMKNKEGILPFPIIPLLLSQCDDYVDDSNNIKTLE
jgi:hypothetical protein